jgi:hypothetical protein
MPGQGPPWWAYIFAAPIVIWMFCAYFGTQPGRPVRCWKIVNGRRVRDYDAERNQRR